VCFCFGYFDGAKSALQGYARLLAKGRAAQLLQEKTQVNEA